MEMVAFILSLVLASLILIPWVLFVCACCVLSLFEGRRKKKWLARQGKEDGQQEKKRPSPSRKVFSRFYDGLYKATSLTIGRIPSNSLRTFLYRSVFKMEIGKKVAIHKGAEIRAGFKIRIGRGTIVGDNCILDGRGELLIGENVNFSSFVSLYTAQHQVNSSEFEGEFAKISVGNRAWISANTIVLPGVTIGEGSVLAAGAVATKDLEPFGIYGGVPAKKIGERNRDLEYEFSGPSTWFF